MKKIIFSSLAAAAFAVVSGNAQIFNDASGDIDPSISTGSGTLDILSTEVSNPTASDIRFSITVNGNISTTDWGNFMVGIATGTSPNTATGNGWGRPINLDSPIGGMNYWLGSWVGGGGGAQLWSYNGASWDQAATGPAISLTAGTTSQISLTMPLTSIGSPSLFYFDVYSSSETAGNTSVDALSNPNIAVTSWTQTYTSSQNPPGTGISVVPEPSTYALLALSAAAVGGYMARRRARK
jgi:hypothetical protein